MIESISAHLMSKDLVIITARALQTFIVSDIDIPSWFTKKTL